MATLAVQEAMGMKVDREAVATLVLPQLWAMSMGPCKKSAIYGENEWLITVSTFVSANGFAIQEIHGCHWEAGRPG